MTSPLVSVIVPAFNCGRFVGEAIESVLTQRYEPFEVVVVDDGSSDDTMRVLAGFGDRIRVFSQTNSGPAAARNHAVREARGQWLAFVDGDDLWLPGHLGLEMSYVASHPDTKVIFGDWLVWDAESDGSYAPMARAAEVFDAEVDPEGTGWLYSKLLFESVIHIIASAVHRSVYEAVGGFDEGLRTGSDYDFWLKVSRRFPFVKLRSPVAVYRQNPASVTNTVRVEDNSYRLLARAVRTYGLTDDAGHHVSSSAVSLRLAELAFAHGYRHYWRGDAKVAVRSFAMALGHRPLHLKAAAYVLASLAKCVGIPRSSAARRT